MEDQQIIALYWQRCADAITHSKEKYGSYCFAIAQNILQNPEDSEECVNDTWLHAWNSMPPHRPYVLRMFFAKLTRSISLDRWRRRNAQKRGGDPLTLALDELSQCIVSESDIEDTLIAQDLEQSIRAFLHTLPAREANVFLRRYFFTESIQEIAHSYGITRNHVSVLLSKTRKQLKQYLIKEGFFDASHGPVSSHRPGG